jgi:hypothetical protein
MMCACDEAIGRRFLAHQLYQGCELETQRRVAVTHGFVAGMCSECRGLPADSAPAAAIPGRTSKIKRYYWRELHFAEMLRQAEWDEQHPDAAEEERRAAHRRIEAEVLEEIKRQHAAYPRYVFSELSQAEVIKRYDVEVEVLSASYAAGGGKGSQILSGDTVISPETFAAHHYERLGWSVAHVESLPFHALFGIMMWKLIQGPFDPLNRIVGFGDRAVWEATREDIQVWTPLPEDFGTKGYGTRRAEEIEAHLAGLPTTRDALLEKFDLWRPMSAELRQYLWAHRDKDVEVARTLVEILPPATITSVLRYLVGNYWGRYLGWPDLLLHRGEHFRFVEVKSSSDKLSDEQKRWIADNHDLLHLPFTIAKIHRRTAS